VNAKGEGMILANLDEARRAFEAGAAELQAQVKIRVTIHEANEDGEVVEVTKLLDTTVGRALLSGILPKGLEFTHINRSMTKKAISNVLNACYRQLGLKKTVVFADRLMYTGFRHATLAGISIGINDMVVPENKEEILAVAEAEVKEIQDQYGSGLVTDGERYNKVVDIWSRTNDQVAKAMMDKLGTETVKDAKGKKVEQESFNSLSRNRLTRFT
jgi:DNA-directed RNA polymerase subunit beta'